MAYYAITRERREKENEKLKRDAGRAGYNESKLQNEKCKKRENKERKRYYGEMVGKKFSITGYESTL